MTSVVLAPPMIIEDGSMMRTASGGEDVCLVRKSRGKAGGDKDVRLKVPANDEAKYLARGFKGQPCQNFRTSLDKAAAHMCHIASLNDAELEAQFFAQHGVTPDELCQLAGGK